MFKEKLYMQRYLLITKWTVIFFQKNMDWRSLAHSGEKIYKEEKHSKDDQHIVLLFFEPCADLQMEIMPCSEEPQTPIVSSCVVAEEATSHEHRLKTFAEEVRRPIRSPLAQRPVKTRKDPFPPPHGHPGLPKRSERLANHPLASVPSSKRAEVMLMRHFNAVLEVAAPNSDSKKTYSELYKEKLDASHFEAMRDLLPALHSSSLVDFTIE